MGDIIEKAEELIKRYQARVEGLSTLVTAIKDCRYRRRMTRGTLVKIEADEKAWLGELEEYMSHLETK